MLDDADGSVFPSAVPALRRLLTSCRKGEILNLRCDEVDLDTNGKDSPNPLKFRYFPSPVAIAVSVAEAV